jgi:acetyl esterase/lipase
MTFQEEILDCDAAGPAPVRVYVGDDLGETPPLVLHLHGGLFLGGSLASGARVAAQIANAGAVVVSVEYARANAKPFPAALEFVFDVLAALKRRCAKFATRKSFLFVAGEEAGGNLAAGVALMARDQGEKALRGQILLSPMLDPFMATGSFRKAEAAGSQCKWADGWNRYLGFGARACHPYAAPAGCMRLAGVAPALVITADDDPARDESLAYARHLREAGVIVRECVLASRTDWPETYADRSNTEWDWEVKLRGEFAAFFQQTGALSC